MAFGNGKTTFSNNGLQSPIDFYLKNIKDKIGFYDKEKGENVIHNLDKFVILDIGYTIKGQIWNDTLQKYTHSYFSNEIKDWNETLYISVSHFIDGTAKNSLFKKGLWSEIKDTIKNTNGISLNLAVTILDLNDNKVKEFFLTGNNFYNNSKILNELLETPNMICSLEGKTLFTNGKKDKDGNPIYITKNDINSMDTLEAMKYKPRYIFEIIPTGNSIEGDLIDLKNKLCDKLDEYFDSRRAYYENKYGKGKEGEYFKLESEEKQTVSKPVHNIPKKDKSIKPLNNSDDEVSIEDIPF